MAHDPAEQPNLNGMKPVAIDRVVQNPVGPPGLPAFPPSPATYLRTPLPAAHQLQPDTLRQFYQKGVPQARITPLPPAAIPANNSTAKGVATTVTNTILKGGGSSSGIALTMPSIFAVSGSPGNNIGVSLVSELANTVFAGPGTFALGALDAVSSLLKKPVFRVSGSEFQVIAVM